MLAVTRLLGVAAEMHGPEAVHGRLVSEARELFGLTHAVLLSVAGREGRAEALAAAPGLALPRGSLEVARFPLVADLLERRTGPVAADGVQVSRLDRALGAGSPSGTMLLLPMRSGDRVTHVLLLGDREGKRFEEEQVEMAEVFAAAASAALAQLAVAEEHSDQVARQAALARAAKTLNESLDLNRVLVRICQEATSILDADNAVVYRGSGEDGVTVEATYGVAPEAIGYRMPPGSGLAGKVAELDRPLLTNDYQGMPRKPDPALFGEVSSSIGVPLHWDGELRGVLAVGYTRPHLVTREQLSLLEAFGELAAAASGNASAHAGLARVARTDGLTGCLNHAAMQDALRREIERCERTGHRLTLVLVDMDDFKQVNEEHGHLAGDEVLRRVGQALRQAVRPYDMVARYGGDEFAIVAVESDESETAELARRALQSVSRSVGALEHATASGSASAGIAEWTPGETSTELIDRADRALMNGKQEGLQGDVIKASAMAQRDGDQPKRVRPTTSALPPEAATEDPPAEWPAGAPHQQTERLRKRTRQLSLANALGTRLAAMTDPQQIMEATVEELHRAFGYFLCAVVRIRDDGFIYSAAGRGESFLELAERKWTQPRSAGVIGRCLRERRPVIVNDAQKEADYNMTPETADVRAELVVPLWVGGELWGAINIEETRRDAFDEDDARLVQTVADQTGSALRSATLYERLDAAYMGTAEALAAALEANDSYTASHSRAVVERAREVGHKLGLKGEELRTLRLAAIFHDIGKIAVTESILSKRGPLTPAERHEIERHTEVGERILSAVDFLSDVLPLVRHEHERWDGLGYPDGLSGEDIPLGSRIILACDAYDAMTTDRPYRAAMSDDQARAELLRNAGAQFDERVVAVLMQVLEAAHGGEAQPAPSESR